jgi:hypothetical protein
VANTGSLRSRLYPVPRGSLLLGDSRVQTKVVRSISVSGVESFRGQGNDDGESANAFQVGQYVDENERISSSNKSSGTLFTFEAPL